MVGHDHLRLDLEGPSLPDLLDRRLQETHGVRVGEERLSAIVTTVKK
jgi:hypothetical protein